MSAPLLGWRGSVLAGLLACAITLCAWASTAEAAKPKFAPKKLPFNSIKLFDLSVADVDEDGDFDMFSANHKYRGSLQISNGEGGFKGQLDRSGLSSTTNVPGFDDLYREPTVAAKGLYIWVDKLGTTHIRTLGLGTIPELPSSTVTGTLTYPLRGTKKDIRYIRTSGAKVTKSADGSTSPPTAVLKFEAGPNADIDARVRFMDLPFKISIDPEFPRSRILAGPDSVHPASNDFKIDLGDRHAVAWADFNGDDNLDAYIANGGARGAIKRLGAVAGDELYLGDGEGHFSEDFASTGVSKGLCRGRYVAPVDYDSDGDLDLLVGCEAGSPQLFMQRIPGKFGERSNELQELKVKGDLIRWLNLDEKGTPELVTVRGKRIFVYARDNAADRFRVKQRLRSRKQGTSDDAIAPADFDGDGDIDIFIGARGGNTLLINKGVASGGKLKVKRPEKFGLPAKGTIAASFVDYDNDGRLDFHAVPGGLYERTGPMRFKATGKVGIGGKADFAVSQWFDYDSDGDRDLVSVLKRQSKILRKRVYENKTNDGHWLQLDLRGPAGNRQAIGAEVVVGKGKRAQTGFVGQNEGARFSSGHYRLYYGLGKAQQTSLRVRWPDGTKTDLSGVRVNQRLEVSYDQ